MGGTFVTKCETSPGAVLKPLPLEQVTLGGYLGRYLNRAIEITIPTQYELLESTGRIDNFRRASGKIKADYQGYFFNDSDVYKWIEGCSYALVYAKGEQYEQLKSLLNKVIAEVIDAQSPDGYLNTYFTFEREKDRWSDLENMHELYCAGHLIQAAIAHHRVTGEKTLLNVALKLADHIESVFGPGKRHGTCGHPEIEMALVELYRETQDPRYLKLAEFFIFERGKGYAGGKEYTVDHKPFLELTEVTGHAVRMLYLCCGVNDLYLESKNEAFSKKLLELWENMTTKKMYITGGVGSRYEGEAFGEEYELPNRRAYAETCASIANFMWNWRMFLSTGDGAFVDTMEQVLYNGLLSGISADGMHYFYVNPLEDLGKTTRKEWFRCACCPTNLARFLPSLPGYIYATSRSENALWINLYESSQCETTMSGEKVEISQTTDYPLSGEVHIDVRTSKPVCFDLLLRIPQWADEFEIYLDEKRADYKIEKGYARITKEWDGSHHMTIVFDFKVRLVQSHPYVRENIGKVAIFRGPILYCAEGVDNPYTDPWRFLLDTDKEIESLEKGDVKLGKTVFLRAKGFELERTSKLYDRYHAPRCREEKEIHLVPYHLWNNRGQNPMVVWLSTVRRA